jgi:TPR repeat protein|mmetsp:Transcript_4695/g.7642  ORF Transcript_4695/g.7642 Transcript_4695/m.7642 type:complete len:323 (-) Transcript_4695:129-1097(-)
MASFDEKVEALRRLRERRQAREEAPEVAPEAVKSEKLEGQEFVDALSHYAYASLQETAKRPALDSRSHDIENSSANTTVTDTECQGAAAQEASALYCLGHCYEQGLHECEKDEAKAAMYYHLAAEQGNAVAQWRLGHFYEFGIGVEASDEFAAHWYRLAAEAGHAQAQSSLGLFLEDGRGGSQDDAEALRWHLAAAEQHQALSQYCVACCLAEGRGATKDEMSARSWLKKSADAGFPPAIEALDCGFRLNAECPEDTHNTYAKNGEQMLTIAERLAKQIQHLSDDDASAFLDDLMGTLRDSSSLDVEELGLSLGRSDLGVAC